MGSKSKKGGHKPNEENVDSKSKKTNKGPNGDCKKGRNNAPHPKLQPPRKSQTLTSGAQFDNAGKRNKGGQKQDKGTVDSKAKNTNKGPKGDCKPVRKNTPLPVPQQLPLLSSKKPDSLQGQQGSTKQSPLPKFQTLTPGAQGGNSKQYVLPDDEPAVNKALRMMEKMGWKQGHGLGQDQQGIIEPIAAVGQVGRSGLGLNIKAGKSKGAQKPSKGNEDGKDKKNNKGPDDKSMGAEKPSKGSEDGKGKKNNKGPNDKSKGAQKPSKGNKDGKDKKNNKGSDGKSKGAQKPSKGSEDGKE